jgi:hypothetical protein
MENSAFGRLIGVLVAPGKTFRSIAERPTWLAAFLVVVLSPVIPAIIAMPKMDWEGITRAQLERMDVQLPQDQLEQRIEMTEKIGPFFAYLAPGLLRIGPADLRARLLGRLHPRRRRAGLQEEPRRRLARHDAGGGVDDPVDPHHPGHRQGGRRRRRAGELPEVQPRRLRPEGANAVVLNLLSHIDVFSIWTLVLLIIGFTWCAKVKQSTSAITVILLWLVYVGIGVGFAALGMAMGGKQG